MKILHTLGAIGLAGGLAAFMMMLAAAPEPAATPEYAEIRGTAAMVSKWLIMPSMLLTLTSGLLSMAVHQPFMDAGWVWLKAILGLLVFEASLASIDGPAKAAAIATTKLQQGEVELAEALGQINDKWVAWWILMAIFAVNVLLAIWRPRLMRHRA